MKVAYLTSQYPEFHETFVAREVEHLIRSGADVTIFTLKPLPPEGSDLYPAHRDNIYYKPFVFSAAVWWSVVKEIFTNFPKVLNSMYWLVKNYRKRPKELLKALIVLPKTIHYANIIRHEKRIVHAHWATIPASMAIIIKKLTGTTITITAHAWDIFLTPDSDLISKVELSEGVVTCTGFNVTHLKQIVGPANENKIRRNYHGIDIDHIDKSGKTNIFENTANFKILAVGRLVEQKGFEYLIKAIKQLSDIIDIELNIIGDGPLHNSLASLANSLSGGNSVNFLGKVPHETTLGYMKQSDLMVAPSIIAGDGDRDGIPNVIIEALACKAVVIATNVSGIPELIKNNDTGLLIKSESVDDLVNAIKFVHDNREKALSYAENGFRYVIDNFDIEKNIEEFINYLSDFHRVENN